jgi:5'-nucleotidase (lipoprotein e(P4) family)
MIATAAAMPGAGEFLSSVKAKGVQVYYVTNRSQANLEGTLKNLNALGFPYADASHVLATAGSGDKQGRFDLVTKDHEVVAYMGDNANDLPIGTYHKSLKDRNALVDQNKDKFGTQFVVLPNPVYGDWEGALADGYFRLAPPQRDEARKAALKVWIAKQ